MDSRTNAIVEAAAKIAANHRHGGNPYAPQSERAEGHDDAAQAIAADIRADLPAAIAAIDAAPSPASSALVEEVLKSARKLGNMSALAYWQPATDDHDRSCPFCLHADGGPLGRGDAHRPDCAWWALASAIRDHDKAAKVATPPAPLPDDVRRDVDAVRAFLVEMRDWSGREIAREAIAAFDRIAARLNANGGSNDR